MVRLLYFLLATLFTLTLRADDLDRRLRLLYPGDGPDAVTERDFLEKNLENVFRQLRYIDKAQRKRAHKRVDIISERFTEQILRQYDPAATLNDAFRSGSYNDATAAVLLALALEEFDVPVTGFVDHWECSLVAATGRRRLTLRHPAAVPHAAGAEQRYRREYVSLVRQTVDGELTELSEAAADSVFYRYYYRPDHRLGFLQLSAYQQLRLAQSAYARGAFDEVKQLTREASLRESRRAFQVLGRAGELQLTSLREPDTEAYVSSLFQLWQREPANQYIPAALLRRFDGQQLPLLKAGELDGARVLLKEYLDRAPREATGWMAELRLLQQLRLLDYYQERGQVAQALHLAQTLHRAEPDNARYRDYFAELTLVNLRRSHPDPQELVAKAEAAAREYPFLREHDRYADIVLRQHALTVRDLFAAGDEAAAVRAVETFRRELKANGRGNDRPLWTLTAFVAASNYYFGERDYAPARAYLAEALQYDPANDFLLHQRDLLDRY